MAPRSARCGYLRTRRPPAHDEADSVSRTETICVPCRHDPTISPSPAPAGKASRTCNLPAHSMPSLRFPARGGICIRAFCSPIRPAAPCTAPPHWAVQGKCRLPLPFWQGHAFRHSSSTMPSRPHRPFSDASRTYAHVGAGIARGGPESIWRQSGNPFVWFWIRRKIRCADHAKMLRAKRISYLHRLRFSTGCLQAIYSLSTISCVFHASRPQRVVS